MALPSLKSLLLSESGMSVALPLVKRGFMLQEDPEDMETRKDTFSYSDRDARSFFFDDIFGTNIGFLANHRNHYHYDFIDMIREVARDVGKHPIDEARMTIEKTFAIDGNNNSLSKFLSSFNGTDEDDEGVEGEGKGESFRSIFITGRLWLDNNAMSFWNKKDRVLKSITKFSPFIKRITAGKMIPENCIYEFIDKAKIYRWKDIQKNLSGVSSGTKRSENRSEEEIAALLKKQHIDPNAKRELLRRGAIVPGGAAKQAAVAKSAGYNSPAAFNFARQMSEGVLNENPDSVGDIGLDWTDEDARSFFVYENGNLGFYGTSRNIVHGDIMEAIRVLLRRKESDDPNDKLNISEIRNALEQCGFKMVGNESHFWKFCYDVLKQCGGDVEDVNYEAGVDYDANEDEDVEPTCRSMTIAGRFWSNSNVASFWCERKRAMKSLSKVIGFLKTAFNAKESSLKFEFIDTAIVKASTLNPKQKAVAPTRSKEEILALMKKQHIDPNAKKQLGAASSTGAAHQAKVASKAGYPHAAAFNFAHRMNESPDGVHVDVDGNDTTLAKWMEQDSYTFFVSSHMDLTVYTKVMQPGNTQGMSHGSLRSAMWKIADKADHTYDSTSVFHQYINGELAETGLKFEYVGNEKDVLKFSKDVRYGGHNYVYGRVWVDKKIISFWSRRDDVVPEWDKIEKFLKHLKLDSSTIKIDFSEREDGDPLDTTSTLGIEPKNVRSKEEVELMRQQHLNPDAKRKLGGTSTVGAAKQGQVAAKAGFDNAAAFNFAHRMNEGVLNEDPDEVYSSGKLIVSVMDDEFQTFIIDPKYRVCFLSLFTHRDMIETMMESVTFGSVTYEEEIIPYLNARNIETIGSPRNIFDFIKKLIQAGSAVFGSMALMRDDTKYGLQGRLWKTKNVVSFWNTRKTILKHWNAVESILKSIFGNLDTLQFDFVEKDFSEPLYRTSDLDVAKKELPMDKIKKLLAKQHIDPKAKAELKAMGIVGASGSPKYSDVAKKAGFPHAAAFQFAHSVRENVGFIKLKDLIKNG